MTTRFKLMRFMLLTGVAAVIVCAVGVFYTHRTGHGTTVEQRTVYDIGEKAGEKALPGATLLTEAELNTTAQKYFEQQGCRNSSKILRERATWRLLNRLFKRVTPPGTTRRIVSSLCHSGSWR
jgi:hypothetical protein